MDKRLIYNEKKKKYINYIVNDIAFGVFYVLMKFGKLPHFLCLPVFYHITHRVIRYSKKNLNKTDFVRFALEITYCKRKIPRYTKKSIEACGIEIHTDGGTKRKLSLIITICSLAKYFILDETIDNMDIFKR
ncbi:hypothetical protein U3516DRAFT_753074 [Neocallimastix sp. 'constans']